MHRSLAAGAFLGTLVSSSALAQPVPGTCSGPECPYWISDVNAAVNASAPCTSEVDPALMRRFRSGGAFTNDEFVRFIAPMAQQSERETGIPASVTIAQAALETGWGKTMRRSANNLFGIKGSGTAGSVKLWTREYVGGRWVRVQARFAAYETLGDSVVAHGKLISEKPRYAGAMAVRNDPAAFAKALQRAGYATDPQYASKLMSIIRNRNLTRFDGSRGCPA